MSLDILREEIIHLLTLMENGELDDTSTCKTIIRIAEILQEIVTLVKKDKFFYKTELSSLKGVMEFSETLSVMIRGRSWYNICREFSPEDALGNIKTLKMILIKSEKKTKKEPETIRHVPHYKEDTGLVDLHEWVAYRNRLGRE